MYMNDKISAPPGHKKRNNTFLDIRYNNILIRYPIILITIVIDRSKTSDRTSK